MMIPDSLGYSIPDGEERLAWRDMVAEIGRALVESGLSDEIVFHGTSSKSLEDIERSGLQPTDIGHACPVKDSYLDGSFWGTILTAAAYAEDTAAERHPGTRPVLLAIRSATLEADGLLLADAATFEYPNQGLTRLSDPEVERRWVESGCDLPWRTSLEELGAIVATHQFIIPPGDFTVVHGVGDVERMVAAILDEDVVPTKGCAPSPA